MRTMLLKELVSHDVLEFCYDIRHPQNWNPLQPFRLLYVR